MNLESFFKKANPESNKASTAKIDVSKPNKVAKTSDVLKENTNSHNQSSKKSKAPFNKSKVSEQPFEDQKVASKSSSKKAKEPKETGPKSVKNPKNKASSKK